MAQDRRSGAKVVSLTEGQPLRKTEMGVGVDRLSVSFPVREFSSDPASWQQLGQVWEDGELLDRRSVQVPLASGVPIYVGVRGIPNKRGDVWGKVEFNPSRVLDPDGASLAPVVALPTALRQAWEAASTVLAPGVEMGEARVKRLDVARDFEDVDRPDFFIRGLLGVKRPWARRTFTYSDPSRNLAETLAVGSGAGMVRLYDKHRERPETVSEGTLRWEVEARGRWLSRYGDVSSVQDINTAMVENLARNRWEWSAMGAEVSASRRVVEKVKRSGLSPAKQRSFLGHLLLVSQGERSELSFTTAAEFNRLQRELGIALSPDVFDGAEGFVSRLDFDSGREVIRAA